MTKFGEEVVKTIPDFPRYMVTSNGRVFNRKTGRELVLSPTASGELTVGMIGPGHYQCRRSVKVLVAEAFVKGRTDIFNTPILVDGIKWHLEASNILWRPRWFAWEYSHQFNKIESWYNYGPILDVVHNIEYDSIFEAAIATASLCKHIFASVSSSTHVFPGGEKYVFI